MTVGANLCSCNVVLGEGYLAIGEYHESGWTVSRDANARGEGGVYCLMTNDQQGVDVPCVLSYLVVICKRGRTTRAGKSYDLEQVEV